jgi:hypothetical protein
VTLEQLPGPMFGPVVVAIALLMFLVVMAAAVASIERRRSIRAFRPLGGASGSRCAFLIAVVRPAPGHQAGPLEDEVARLAALPALFYDPSDWERGAPA